VIRANRLILSFRFLSNLSNPFGPNVVFPCYFPLVFLRTLNRVDGSHLESYAYRLYYDLAASILQIKGKGSFCHGVHAKRCIGTKTKSVDTLVLLCLRRMLLPTNEAVKPVEEMKPVEPVKKQERHR
jgi:hypothetical protein